jgi:hypothetical protein
MIRWSSPATGGTCGLTHTYASRNVRYSADPVDLDVQSRLI